MAQFKIAVLVGSLRKESLNRKMAKTLISLAPESLAMEIIEIGSLPLFNEDLDANKETPLAWSEFRKKVRQSDAVLFVTPEYNRSVPGVLKNAIDVGSRPYSENIWDGKPAAVVSVSPGACGGFGANHHLRQSLVCLNMPAMPVPETYLGNAGKFFDTQGQLGNEDLRVVLVHLMEAYAKWVFVHAPQREAGPGTAKR